MGTTYTLIASSVIGSGGAASFDFTSIPATYTDLVIKLSCRLDVAANRTQIYVKYNGSSANYTAKRLYGEDNAVGLDTLSGSTGYSFGVTNADNSTASTFNNAEIYIAGYAESRHKSSFTDTNMTNVSGSTYDNWMTANLWSDTTAINQITITGATGSFKQYSSAFLYGIRNS